MAGYGSALSLAQVAERLGVSVSTVSRLISAGRLRRVPHIGVVRVTEQSLAAFLGETPVDSGNPWDAILSDVHAD